MYVYEFMNVKRNPYWSLSFRHTLSFLLLLSFHPFYMGSPLRMSRLHWFILLLLIPNWFWHGLLQSDALLDASPLYFSELGTVHRRHWLISVCVRVRVLEAAAVGFVWIEVMVVTTPQTYIHRTSNPKCWQTFTHKALNPEYWLKLLSTRH